MTTQVPTKNFHNITANDNAVLHLGDIIYTYGEGGRGEGIALQQIVERLDYIIGCNDRIRNVSEAQNGELEQSNPELLHVKHTTKAPKRVFSTRSGTFSEKATSHAPYHIDPVQVDQTQFDHSCISPKYIDTVPKLQWQRHDDTTVTKRNLSIGTLVLRRQRLRDATEYRYILRSTEHWRMSVQFIPKIWLSHKILRLRLEWSLFQQRISHPSFNPSFADIVPNEHPMIVCAASGDVKGLRTLLSLKDGPRPSCTTLAGWTPLHFAAAAGCDEACQLLLHNGAAPDVAGVSSINPLHVAAHFGKLKVFRTLLNAGGDVSDVHEHGMSPLFDLLTKQSLIDTVEFHRFVHWIIRGQEDYLIDTETSDNEGRSVFHYLLRALRSISNQCEDPSIVVTHAQNFHALISAGADLDASDVYGKTLLHIACEQRQFEIVQVLLERGCDIEIRDANDYTALHQAVQNEDCELALLLITHGADPQAIARPAHKLPRYHDYLQRVTPLSLVAVNGNMDMCELLWNAIVQKCGGETESDNYLTLLVQIASDLGNIEFVKRLANTINSKDYLSQILGTMLDTTMIEILVEAGASADGVSETVDAEFPFSFMKVWRPLVWAANNNSLAAVQKLLSLGANVDITDTDGMSALHSAAENGNSQIIDLLLCSGADHEACTKLGRSPADLAISSGFYDLASKLTRNSQLPAASPSPGTRTESGYSLLVACQTDDTDLARRLIAAGASLDAFPTDHLWTSLHLALSWSSFNVAELLIASGASVQPSYQQQGEHRCRIVPLLDAAAKCNSKLMKLMIDMGANVNENLEEGDTPLLCVLDRFWCSEASEARADAVVTLLEAGAEVNVEDVFGRTPLGNAAQLGNLKAISALVQRGAELNEWSTMNTDTVPNIEAVLAVAPRTPIAWAALRDHKEAVRALYRAGAQWKGLKKDPAMTYIHGFLMESWFINPFKTEQCDSDSFKTTNQPTGGSLSTCSTEEKVIDISPSARLITDRQQARLSRTLYLQRISNVNYRVLVRRITMKASESAVWVCNVIKWILIEVLAAVIVMSFLFIFHTCDRVSRLIIGS